jgi:ATP dependent DNA ligase domain
MHRGQSLQNKCRREEGRHDYHIVSQSVDPIKFCFTVAYFASASGLFRTTAVTDLRKLPLSMRKTNLARLLARRPDGIFVAPFEAGEIGPDLFRKACEFGLEGLVSKRRDSVYRAGRSPSWIKVKNRTLRRWSGSRRRFRKL